MIGVWYDSLTLWLSLSLYSIYIYMYSTKYTWRVIGRKAQISRTWWKHAYTTRTMTMIYCIMMAYGIWNRYPDRYMQMVPGSQYAPNELHVHCSMILHFPVFSACSKTQHTHTQSLFAGKMPSNNPKSLVSSPPKWWEFGFPNLKYLEVNLFGMASKMSWSPVDSMDVTFHGCIVQKDCGGWEMDGRWWDMIPSKLRVRHLLTPMVGTPYMIFKNFA